MQWQVAAKENKENVLQTVHSSTEGLSAAEATDRLAQYGPNRVRGLRAAWWRTLARQFRSSFVILVLCAAALSFFLGEHIEAGMMLLFIGINTFLGFIQEHRSERTLEALSRYLVSRVRVRRDSEELSVESDCLVPGDIVLVEAGDRIPADIRLLEVTHLFVNEEVLTGEAVPVEKSVVALPQGVTQMYEAANMGFGGTTVLRGTATGVVIATGQEAVMGEIAGLTQSMKRESGFERGMLQFSRFILQLVIVTLLLIFLANVLLKGEGANVVELLIFSLVLVVSVIPEALPFIITVSLSRGSLRLAKKHVVVKRLSAIEDLGSVEVLCTDKTGTLTENKLSVEDIIGEGREAVLEAAALASAFVGEEKQKDIDPFDTALWKAVPVERQAILKRFHKQSELPFDPDRRRNSVVVMEDDKAKLIVRGAPETLMDLSSNVSAEQRASYEQWMTTEGKEGHRVLGVAMRDMADGEMHTSDAERGLTFLGVVAFEDPIKETTIDALEQARKLGVQVKIVTGDSKEVSGAVAHQIGLIDAPEKVLLGSELQAMSHAEKAEAVEQYAVFARISPQQKYEIIQLLQEKYEVGFLGEGINDAPALKLANVALVVNSASDIAREATDVVLLDSSLAVIVTGIQEGRKIFANMIKYIRVTLTSNFGNFYSVALASLLIPFVPMLPVQILLIDILSDFPMLSLATDAVDAEELRRPKTYEVRHIVLFTLLMGVVSSVFDFILFASFYQKGEAQLQTHWFLLSVLTELVLIYSLRSWVPFWRAKRPAMLLVGLSSLIGIVAVTLPFTAFGGQAFRFIHPTTFSFLWVVSLVLIYFAATETVKYWYARNARVTR